MKNMLRAVVILSIYLAATVSFVHCWGESTVKEKRFITLDGDSLSISAQEVSAESIFKDLGEVCGLKIVTHEHAFPNSLVSIKFSNVPLEKAVKKILKVTGARNYLIRYKETEKTCRITGIDFLGSKGESQILTPGREPVQQTKVVPKTPEGRPAAKTVVHSEQEIDDKIEAIEKKFKWDNDKTAELVKQLLRGAPSQFRKYALENMTESIKNQLEKAGDGPVDKEMVYESLEDAVPPDMPEMKEGIKKYLDSLDN